MPRSTLHTPLTIRPVSGWVLGGFVVLHTVLLLAVHAPVFSRVVGTPIVVATGGWISESLTATLLMAFVVVGVWLRGVGGLRWLDLGVPTGWNGGWKVLNAVVLTYLLWGLAQLIVVGLGVVGLTSVRVDPTWGPALGPTVGEMSTLTVVVNAALEEVMYRGFLFIHLWAFLTRRCPDSRTYTLMGALIVSQGLFGLNHIPAGLLTGIDGWMLAAYVLQSPLVGILFAILFLQTDNLFLVIGLHALINEPRLPFVVGVDASFLILVLVLGLMLLRPLFGRHLDQVLGSGTAPSKAQESDPDCTLTGSSRLS